MIFIAIFTHFLLFYRSPKEKVLIESGFFKRKRKNIYCVEKYLNREY